MPSMFDAPVIDNNAFFTITDSMPVGVWVRDPDGWIVYINAAGQRLLGNTTSVVIEPQFLGRDLRLFRVGTDCDYPTEALAADSYFTDIEIRRDDAAVPIEMWTWAIRDAAGKPVYTVSVFNDVARHREAEISLRQNEARYRLLAENINDMICLHDPAGRYVFVSPSSRQLLGFAPEEVVGGDPYTLFHPDDAEHIRTQAHQAALLESKADVSITYRMRHKAGHYIWLETLTKPILDNQGNVAQLQTTSRDVSERIKTQQKLRHDALHDGLTQLPNRVYMLQCLTQALKKPPRDQISVVMFLDFDRFKVINDSLGHAVGDELLVAIAGKLNTLVRDTDLVSRLGGDEFVILMEDVDSIQEATHIASRIARVMQSPITLQGRELFCSVSIGIVVLNEHYQNPIDVLRDADIAMYRAKRLGGGRHTVFDPAMHFQVVAQMKLENDLRSALGKHQFFLQYQPIISLSTGDLLELEALIRWRHPTDGIISPCKFIPVAEECRLIYAIGLWVIKQACADYARWRRQFPAMPAIRISVNLSLEQVKDPAFVSDVLSVLADYAALGEFLTFEITESMLIHDFPAMAKLLLQLRTHGIKISIDDFGTGYSSLSYLHQLPVDTLKVDQSFVQGDMGSGGKFNIVQTIVTLSNSLGLVVIAEGIEDDLQLRTMQRLGCEKGQGYWFARPLDRVAVEDLLASPGPFKRIIADAMSAGPDSLANFHAV